VSVPVRIEALLVNWMVESGEFPELHVGQIAEMSPCSSVRSIDGVGEVPRGATRRTPGDSQALVVEVTWVRTEKRGLYLAARRAGAPLAGSHCGSAARKCRRTA
jgi:hypothetical protein